MTDKTKRPFEGLRCPHCGDEDTLSIKVDTLALECLGCSEEVGKSEVEEMIVVWSRLWAWLESAAEYAATK